MIREKKHDRACAKTKTHNNTSGYPRLTIRELSCTKIRQTALIENKITLNTKASAAVRETYGAGGLTQRPAPSRLPHTAQTHS